MKKPAKSYTITEAAKKLGISRQAVHGAIRKGQLEAKRGKIVQTRIVKSTVMGWKISPESLEDYRVSALHQTAGKKTS
jgi:excisionase family DNA binding protein